MFSVTKRFEFDYGHRVLGHGGKCKNVHGHHGIAEVTVNYGTLNKLGMVIDFADLKDVVKGFIDTYWDHNILLNYKDPLLKFLHDTEEIPPYVMGCYQGTHINGVNPTAEEMARELHFAIVEKLKPYKIVNVRIYETPSCWSDFTKE
jgi:6-pyruvoyltetrahydropterin/6-carboxytetrahydropterin synthase